MLGSAASVANPNIVLNTAVADALRTFRMELSQTPAEEMEHGVHELLKKAIKKHKRIIFNGNGYTEEWVKEAEKRGLFHLKTTPDALPEFISEKNVKLLTEHRIFTKEELFSRYEIWLENYVKVLHIESQTMAEMIQKDLLPSVVDYMEQLARTASAKKHVVPDISVSGETQLLKRLSQLNDSLLSGVALLKEDTDRASSLSDIQKSANLYKDQVLLDMDALRKVADEAEALLPDQLLPYPTYGKLLFSI